MPGLYLSFTDLQCIPTDIPLISIFSDIFPVHVNKFRSRQLNKKLDTSRDLTFSASQIVNIIKYPPVESRIPKLNNCGQRTWIRKIGYRYMSFIHALANKLLQEIDVAK